MTKHTPKLIALALTAALAAPLAFAQEAGTETDAAATAPTAQAAPEAPAAQASAPAKQSWADVDTDKDGALSQTEAAAVPSLVQVFGEADTDADGSLTADEYKAYVAKNSSGSPEPQG